MTYDRDWDCDGLIRMKDAKTVKLYEQLRNEQPSYEQCFSAFTQQRFDEEYQKLVAKGQIKDGEKVYYAAHITGLYGTKEGLDKVFEFNRAIDDRIKNECDPQEVYFYEYNNYECMNREDGDKPAIITILHIFGEEVARSIKRYSNYSSIDEIIKTK